MELLLMSWGLVARRMREWAAAGELSRLEEPDIGDMARPAMSTVPLLKRGEVVVPLPAPLPLPSEPDTTSLLPALPERMTEAGFLGSCDSWSWMCAAVAAELARCGSLLGEVDTNPVDAVWVT